MADDDYELEFSLPDDEANSEEEGDSDCDDEMDPLFFSPEKFTEDEVTVNNEEWGTNASYFDNLKLSFDEEPIVNVYGKEIDFFQKIFDETILSHIVQETNKYAVQDESKNWTETTKEEIKAFIGILIYMGIHRLPAIDHYWSSDPVLRVDAVAEVMTAKRFKKILQNIHLNDNLLQLERSEAGYDKLHKIRPVVDIMNSNIANHSTYVPSSFASVDESMVPFKGRSTMKQYMPKKPVKRGYKVWCIADSKTGFIFKFRIYTGKSDSLDDTTLGEKVVLSLTTEVRTGSLVVFDNFFSSVSLMERLTERKLYSCGTVNSTRKNLPEFMRKNPKSEKGQKLKIVLKRGEYQFQTKGKVSATKWMDSKPVCMLSTAHNPKTTTSVDRKNKDGTKTPVPCPEVVAVYNKMMGGVDRFDQLRERYAIGRRSVKWWHRLLYFLIDLAIVNGFILWKHSKQNMKKLDQLSYRLVLARQLIQGFTTKKRPGRPTNYKNKKRTVPDDVKFVQVGQHMPIKEEKYRRCRFCSTKKREKRTRNACTYCKVPLCVDSCFYKFHTTKTENSP